MRFGLLILLLAGTVANADTPLGANLNNEMDWVGDRAFVNMFLTTRGLYALPLTYDWFGNYIPVAVDSKGWPLADFWTRVSDTGSPVGVGTYTVSFTGPAGVMVGPGVSGATMTRVSYEAASGKTVWTATLNAQSTVLEFFFTATQGQVKNVQVVRPGYSAKQLPVFSTPFLKLLQTHRPTVLRFMEWRNTNGNIETDWSDRTPLDYATQTSSITKMLDVDGSGSLVSVTQPRGIAWEYCVDLANQLSTDIWINVPLLATDDYVSQLAALIKGRLNPKLNIYIEYSNEVWNGGFSQSRMNYFLAQKQLGTGPGALNYDGTTDTYAIAARRVARRIKEIGDIFRGSFGETGTAGRIRPVLAWQIGGQWTIERQLEYIAANFGKPNLFLNAVAVAPYFNLNGHDGATNLTSTDVLNALGESLSGMATSGVIEQHAAQAKMYGLGLYAYEGGPDTFGPNNVAAKKAASLDSRMNSVVQKYLNIWFSQGGGLFNWFTLGAGTYDSQYGTWSITDDLANLSEPKELAYIAMRAGAMPALTVGSLPPVQIDARAFEGAQWPPLGAFTIPFIAAGSTFDYLLRSSTNQTVKLKATLTPDPLGHPLVIQLNGDPVGQVAAPKTAPAGQWVADTGTLAIPLKTGLNALRLVVPDNRPFAIDSITILGSNGALPTRTMPISDFGSYYPSVGVGTPLQVTFNVADLVTPASLISVTVTSNNTTVVPNSSITVESGSFNGTWGGTFNRRLTVTPASAGMASLTVTLTNAAGVTRSAVIILTAN